MVEHTLSHAGMTPALSGIYNYESKREVVGPAWPSTQVHSR